jgi:hypothetical protein
MIPRSLSIWRYAAQICDITEAPQPYSTAKTQIVPAIWRASLDKIICLPNLGFVLENVAFVLDLVILGL